MTIPQFELDQRLEELKDQKIIVTYDLGPINPFAPQTYKEDREIKMEVRYFRLRNDEHTFVVDALQQQFKPGLNMLMWDSHGSKDIADYTEVTGSYIQDFHELGGYNGNDGRYVINFSLNIKYPR